MPTFASASTYCNMLPWLSHVKKIQHRQPYIVRKWRTTQTPTILYVRATDKYVKRHNCFAQAPTCLLQKHLTFQRNALYSQRRMRGLRRRRRGDGRKLQNCIICVPCYCDLYRSKLEFYKKFKLLEKYSNTKCLQECTSKVTKTKNQEPKGLKNYTPQNGNNNISQKAHSLEGKTQCECNQTLFHKYIQISLRNINVCILSPLIFILRKKTLVSRNTWQYNQTTHVTN